MAEKIRAFSVILGPAGAGFTKEKLERRKKEVQNEIFTLIPATKFLINSMLQEYVIAEQDQLILAFDLVESPQLSLDFDTDKKLRRISAVNQLISDSRRLLESAQFSQIRIGDLARLSTNILINADGTTFNQPEIDQGDLSLWQLIHSYRGKHLQIRFPDEDINLQFPDIPVFHVEQKTRMIRAHINNIAANRVELVSVKEIKSDCHQLELRQLPKQIPMERPANPDLVRIWPLLHVATDFREVIEAEVRVALHADTHEPAYFELVNIVSASQKTPVFESTRTQILFHAPRDFHISNA